MTRTPYDASLTTPLPKLLIRLGALCSWFLPATKGGGVFFFFPYWHVGGAEKVHGDIVNCVKDARPWVFLTHQSVDSKFRHLFSGADKIFNVWALFKYALPFFIGLVSGMINRHQRGVVFGCNSRFFYKLLPYLKKHIRRIDLMHAFGGGSEFFSLEAVPYLDTRVVINAKTVSDFEAQYRAQGVRLDYLKRVQVIENKVNVPSTLPEKKPGRLKILYVGRGSEEKRVHLVGQVATACKSAGIHADFILVGDVESAISAGDRASCIFKGEVSDSSIMEEIYLEAHLLLLTSSREGFPMVVMEAMAYGVIPACTSVGGIPLHVHDQVNGFLTAAESEDEIVADLVKVVADMASDAATLTRISHAAYGYAKEHFNSGDFCAAYRKLLLGGI